MLPHFQTGTSASPVITDWQHRNSGTRGQINFTAVPGCSGGPVFLRKTATLIGILWGSGLLDPEGNEKEVPIAEVAKLAHKLEIQGRTISNGITLPPQYAHTSYYVPSQVLYDLKKDSIEGSGQVQ